MLSLSDVKDFRANNYYYYNPMMKKCTTSGFEFLPKQGKFTINDKTISLYIYYNPWSLYFSNVWGKTEAINSIFQYCIVCGHKNFEDYDFDNIAFVEHVKSPVNCNKIQCQRTMLELVNDKYINLLQAILDKNTHELQKYTH